MLVSLNMLPTVENISITLAHHSLDSLECSSSYKACGRNSRLCRRAVAAPEMCSNWPAIRCDMAADLRGLRDHAVRRLASKTHAGRNPETVGSPG